MKRTLSLIGIGVLAAALALLERYGLEYHLYFRLFWFDIVMHILGGAVVGSSYLWMVRFEFPERMRAAYSRFVSVFFFVFFVGVLWEIFEWYFKIAGSVFMPYWLDTAKDLADDVIGGTFAYFGTMHLWKK